MENSTILKSRRLLALSTALLAAVTTVAVSVAPVKAAETPDPLANVDVGIINIIGVRANATAPFYIKGEPFGAGVWKPLSPPVKGDKFAAMPSSPNFPGADCHTETRRVQIVATDGATSDYNLVGYTCVQPSGASTTNGLYDIVGGTGRFADWTAGGGIFSIDEKADGQAFLALSGMHCPRCASMR
jgi:hypothetical protein